MTRTDERGKSKAQRRARSRYHLTPRAWNKPCSHCGAGSSIAYRHRGRTFACADCIERLGIKAGESRAWIDGGSKADPTVTVRHVDPETLRSDAGSAQNRETR